MITINFINETVCEYFKFPVEVIDYKTRKREIVQCRQLSMYFAKALTKHSLATIGTRIGGKDHATVLHACKTVNNLIDTDTKFKSYVQELEGIFKKVEKESKMKLKVGEEVWTYDNMIPIQVYITGFNYHKDVYTCRMMKPNLDIKTVYERKFEELYYIHPDYLYDTAYIDNVDTVNFSFDRCMKNNFIVFLKSNYENHNKVFDFIKNFGLYIVDANGFVWNDTYSNKLFLIASNEARIVKQRSNLVVNTDPEKLFERFKTYNKSNCVSIGYSEIKNNWDSIQKTNLINIYKNEQYYKKQAEAV